MRFTAPLLLTPLLASAIPTTKQLAGRGRGLLDGQSESGGQVVLGHGQTEQTYDLGSGVGVEGFSLDLEELRLVQFDEDEPPVWISELEKIEAKSKGRRFMDITDTPTLGFSSFLLPSTASVRYSYPTPGNHSSTSDHIKKVYKGLSLDHMKTFLKEFSGFRTRYYRSETGKASQQFLLKTIGEIAKDRKDITIKEFPHSWGQNSIIVRFHPADKKAENEAVVIVGAHQDSTNQWPFLPAPGADDDGSGTTSSLEALRALVHANYTPSTPVEFHYFSAEEGGLLGSQAIAKAYEDEGRKVKAMLQMDMTAWVKKGTTESVGIIQDFVDPDLTEFLYELVETYLDISPVKTQCSYACSDHASFRKAGYQSAFAIESTFENSNHGIHTTQDTMDHPEFSFTHMREFSKLAIAFAIELAGEKTK